MELQQWVWRHVTPLLAANKFVLAPFVDSLPLTVNIYVRMQGPYTSCVACSVLCWKQLRKVWKPLQLLKHLKSIFVSIMQHTSVLLLFYIFNEQVSLLKSRCILISSNSNSNSNSNVLKKVPTVPWSPKYYEQFCRPLIFHLSSIEPELNTNNKFINYVCYEQIRAQNKVLINFHTKTNLHDGTCTLKKVCIIGCGGLRASRASRAIPTVV
jgi:hypothetical protein